MKALVKTVAPSIASVFGTPLAGMGVSAILEAILPEGEAKPAKPEEYIAKMVADANPEIMLKLKTAEQNFALTIKQLDIDLDKYLGDLESRNDENARSLKKFWLSSGKFDYEPILAAAVCISFGYAEVWVLAHAATAGAMDPNAAVLIGRVLGTVDAAFMLLLSFRWGTSHGSQQKDQTIDRIVNHKPDAPAK
jgi:hypothetical protein